MSRLRLDPSVLSIPPSASGRSVQAESAYGPHAAVHRLRLFGIHPKCCDGTTSAACFHSAGLFVGLARASDLLLDLSQHTLVSVRFLSIGLETGHCPPRYQCPGLPGGPVAAAKLFRVVYIRTNRNK